MRSRTAGVMTTLMRNGRDRRLGKPAYVPCEARTRAIGWDPISGLHQGQRPERPRSKAEYMAAPERFAEMPDFSLAPRAPSIHGTKPKSRLSALVTLLGDKPTSLGIPSWPVNFVVDFSDAIGGKPDIRKSVETALADTSATKSREDV